MTLHLGSLFARVSRTTWFRLASQEQAWPDAALHAISLLHSISGPVNTSEKSSAILAFFPPSSRCVGTPDITPLPLWGNSRHFPYCPGDSLFITYIQHPKRKDWEVISL